MSTPGSLSLECTKAETASEVKSTDTEHQTILIQMMTLVNHPKELGPGDYAKGSVQATKILHDGEDDKPTIALAVYRKDHLPEESNDGHAHALDNELVRQLEDHFQDLQSESEEKTGRKWTPLRVWPKNLGAWDDGEV
ncbi:hypothetical protein DE146DRAFT_754075 [Phaeosphaeria sp. MPI-PUGE-AT-0046c]|nr:hypothetical protein DE146DRAFT_754075 [Phaeosphaeria sp. MPI-PUGE-AT-0046c]